MTGTLWTYVAKTLAHLRRGGRRPASPDDVMVELTALGFRGLKPSIVIGGLTAAAGTGLAAYDHHASFLYLVSAALIVDVTLAMAVVLAFDRRARRDLSARSALLWQCAWGIVLWIFCGEVAAANLHFFLMRDQTGEHLSSLAVYGIAVHMGARMGLLPSIAGGALGIMFGSLAAGFYLSGLPRHLLMSGLALMSGLLFAKAEWQKFALLVDQFRLQRRFQDLAETDPLTGIANRRQFRARLDGACQRRGDLVLFLIDLDRFKAVNDTFGHEAGDQLLLQVAARLRPLFGRDDVVARLGGDEFAVLLLGCREEAPRDVAARIVSTLSASYLINSQSIQIGASVGWCFGREEGHDPDAVIQHADAWMYRSKNHRSASRAEDMLPEKQR